jgi:hypothetical protein
MVRRGEELGLERFGNAWRGIARTGLELGADQPGLVRQESDWFGKVWQGAAERGLVRSQERFGSAGNCSAEIGSAWWGSWLGTAGLGAARSGVIRRGRARSLVEDGLAGHGTRKGPVWGGLVGPGEVWS